MATYSSILVWRIPWTEKSGGLQSIGSHRVDTAEQAHTYFLAWEEKRTNHVLPVAGHFKKILTWLCLVLVVAPCGILVLPTHPTRDQFPPPIPSIGRWTLNH